MATPFCKNSAFPDFSWEVTYAHQWTWDFMKFWASRKSKNKQKMTFCHIFDTQKAVLGDCNFGGANDHQIQKFHLGWKVDIQTFPTSPLFPHLDTWKCLKISSKVARPVQEERATCWAVFTGIHLQLRNSPSFDQFWLVMGFFTLFDVINVFSCWHDTYLPILEDSFMK